MNQLVHDEPRKKTSVLTNLTCCLRICWISVLPLILKTPVGTLPWRSLECLPASVSFSTTATFPCYNGKDPPPVHYIRLLTVFWIVKSQHGTTGSMSQYLTTHTIVLNCWIISYLTWQRILVPRGGCMLLLLFHDLKGLCHFLDMNKMVL